jgi:tRNA (guanine-N7-)-methyltransferase
MRSPEIRNKLWSICSRTPVYSPLVLKPSDKPTPFPIKELFPPSIDKFFLELGCGWGEVGLDLAQNFPQTGFILMERKWDRLAQADLEARSRNLQNILFSGINFQWFLDDIFPDRSFDEILLNFPDPWPKRKHFKNRAIQPKFLEILSRKLIPGGRFTFATDHSGYARWTIRELRRFGKFSFREEFSWKKNHLPYSVFEKEKLEEGKRIYYFERFNS